MSKRVLVVGQGSYIGTQFVRYSAQRYGDKQLITSTVSSENGAWEAADFTQYDAVLHVAGIAHIKQRKALKPLYEAVNTELPIKCAQAAKKAGVKHFTFISSMAVDTAKDLYADSKRAAEVGLLALESPEFSMSIIRPPMVYGAGCKGNFPRMVRLVMRAPFFPNIANKRSMIHIDNLCEFLCQCILENKKGIYKPQNKHHVCTTDLARQIAAAKGKALRTTRFFNPLVRLLARFVSSFNKLFGSLYYPLDGSEEAYNIIDFEESVKQAVCINT